MTTDNNTKENNKDFKITVSLTKDNIPYCGEILSTKRIHVDRDTFAGGPDATSGISLDDLHTFFIDNNNSSEATYNYLVDYLSTNKDNPELIGNTISSILAELGTKYDSNVKHGNVGTNQAEYLETVFSTGKGEETGALICGTIHNFLRDALQDAGFEAVTVSGGQTSNKAKNEITNHATLIYRNPDGAYTFNNYGSSAVIKANNILDATQIVYRDTGLLESAGQEAIFTLDSSYQKYGLDESAAFGDQIDKREFNNTTPMDNPVANNSSIALTGNLSSSNNLQVTTIGTFASPTKNGEQSLTTGIEVKKSNKNSEFLNSYSIGGFGKYARNVEINEQTSIGYNFSGTFSHTQGTLGTQEYLSPSGVRQQIQDTEMKYETFAGYGAVNLHSKLHQDNNFEITNYLGASASGYCTLGIGNHYSIGSDGRFTLEDGVSINTNNFYGNLSGGAIIDVQQDNNGYKPTVGGKLNIGAGYTRTSLHKICHLAQIPVDIRFGLKVQQIPDYKPVYPANGTTLIQMGKLIQSGEMPA